MKLFKSGICISVISLIYRRFTFDQEKRECLKEMDGFIERVSYYLWTIGSIIIHVLLVFLLVHPLAKSIRFRKTASQQSAAATNLSRLIRRCLLISIFCVGTDILVTATSQYSDLFEGKRFLRECVYNANVVFNSVAITMTFKGWRVMCFPWRRFRGKEAR